MEYNPSGSSLHGMLQVIILERITISSSRGSSLGMNEIFLTQVLWNLFFPFPQVAFSFFCYSELRNQEHLCCTITHLLVIVPGNASGC